MEEYIFWTEGIASGTADVFCNYYVTKNPDFSELAKSDDTNVSKILGHSEDEIDAYHFTKEEFYQLKDIHPFNEYEWKVV
ncbi:hypothetical protein [Enterococcus sp. DIV0800]|uniref:hypothetical protein n=1 Tax=unclassified Enterococcus TaxID=2608891 RepID=UPI003D3006E9